jgi:hypothetical protein
MTHEVSGKRSEVTESWKREERGVVKEGRRGGEGGDANLEAVTARFLLWAIFIRTKNLEDKREVRRTRKWGKGRSEF